MPKETTIVPATDAKVKPTKADIIWASGFLEGEGWFGYWGQTQRALAGQVNREPILRLHRLFGGSLVRRDAVGNQKEVLLWRVYGSRARNVMDKVYSLMSRKRKKQIRDAMNGGR